VQEHICVFELTYIVSKIVTILLILLIVMFIDCYYFLMLFVCFT